MMEIIGAIFLYCGIIMVGAFMLYGILAWSTVQYINYAINILNFMATSTKVETCMIWSRVLSRMSRRDILFPSPNICSIFHLGPSHSFCPIFIFGKFLSLYTHIIPSKETRVDLSTKKILLNEVEWSKNRAMEEVTCNVNDMAILTVNEKDHCEASDRIITLPEDIVLAIFSQLGMKEAAKTSIIAKDWRYLWTNMDVLDFDHIIILPNCRSWFDPESFEVPIYVNWVNHVIRVHSAPMISKLRVRFAFYECDFYHIDRWVNFALSKKVRNLELVLQGISDFYVPMPFYTLGFDTIKPSLLNFGVSFLLSLHLSGVKVSGEFLEFILLQCNLEKLFVNNSEILVTLKVVSSTLKQLTIRNCRSLDELGIDAVNLSYLDYNGLASIEYKSVPKLVEAAFGGDCCMTLVPIYQQISCIAWQLFKFSLDLSFYHFMENSDWGIVWIHPSFARNIPIEGIPCFSNMKRLELKVTTELYDEIVGITTLLWACPVLCEFKMEVEWELKDHLPEEANVLKELDLASYMNTGETNDFHHKMAELDCKAFPNLRVFEYAGFRGDKHDVDFVLEFLDMATQLDDFICRPLTYWDLSSEDLLQVCRRRAQKLERFVAPKVTNYVII